jgi:hypothetical protein
MLVHLVHFFLQIGCLIFVIHRLIIYRLKVGLERGRVNQRRYLAFGISEK